LKTVFRNTLRRNFSQSSVSIKSGSKITCRMVQTQKQDRCFSVEIQQWTLPGQRPLVGIFLVKNQRQLSISKYEWST